MSQRPLVEQQADAVHRYVRRRLFPAVDQVDDLVQEIPLAAWKSLPAREGTAPLQAWMLGIARHKVDDHYRRSWRCRRVASLDDYEPAIPCTLDEQLARAQCLRRMSATLDLLGIEYRTVLLLRYWHRRSTQEIASHLGRTEKSVERLLARARSQFRLLWEQPLTA